MLEIIRALCGLGAAAKNRGDETNAFLRLVPEWLNSDNDDGRAAVPGAGERHNGFSVHGIMPSGYTA